MKDVWNMIFNNIREFIKKRRRTWNLINIRGRGSYIRYEEYNRNKQKRRQIGNKIKSADRIKSGDREWASDEEKRFSVPLKLWSEGDFDAALMESANEITGLPLLEYGYG